MGTRTAVAIGITILAIGLGAVWLGSRRMMDGQPRLQAVPQAAPVVAQPATDKTVPRAIASAGAQPSTPDYGPRPDRSPPIYRCGARGSTVYSNTPCEGARVVDEANAVSGYDSRPSERMERLVAQGRVVEEPAAVRPASRIHPRDPDEGRDCETMRRQIVDIDADALQPHSYRWLDALRTTRRDIRTRMAREHC